MSLKRAFIEAINDIENQLVIEMAAGMGAALAVATGVIGLACGASLPHAFMAAAAVGVIPGVIAGTFALGAYGASKGMDLLKATVRRADPAGQPVPPPDNDMPGTLAPKLFY